MKNNSNSIKSLVLSTLILTSIGAAYFLWNQGGWKPILRQLNQKPFLKSPILSNRLEADLQEKYKNEQATIKQNWKIKAMDLEILPYASSSRKERNQYFHEQVTIKNQLVVGKVHSLANMKNIYQEPAKKLDLLASIMDRVRSDPVLSAENITKHPNAYEVGYCFGRAMIIHKYLLDQGIKQSSIVKLFVLGQMKVGDHLWNFHVAVGVHHPTSGLIVLDPLKEKILDFDQWLAQTQTTDIKYPKTRLRLYITDPRKFLPAFGRYDTSQLNEPQLKQLFDELLGSLKSSH